MALTFLKVYDCMIFVNYYMDWTEFGYEQGFDKR